MDLLIDALDVKFTLLSLPSCHSEVFRPLAAKLRTVPLRLSHCGRLLTHAILSLVTVILVYVLNSREHPGGTGTNHRRISCSMSYQGVAAYARITLHNQILHTLTRLNRFVGELNGRRFGEAKEGGTSRPFLALFKSFTT